MWVMGVAGAWFTALEALREITTQDLDCQRQLATRVVAAVAERDALALHNGTSALARPTGADANLATSFHRRYAICMKDVEDRVAGSLLQLARTRLGLSQTAFADLLGIAQPTLSAYESGRRQPTLPTLLRLLGRAGLELRLELSDLDNHDAVLADWELTLDDANRERLRAQGYRLASDAA
jgi:transcriptional regulator with XRE-family HTH domain